MANETMLLTEVVGFLVTGLSMQPQEKYKCYNK